MKKFNNYQSVGLVFIAIYLIINYSNVLPDALKGFCFGIGISFMLIGAYAQKHDISEFRNNKIKFFKKLIGR
jgi:hypothetical protein